MKSRGFSLIETIIYVAIIGGVMLAFVNFALSISSSSNKTFVVQEVQANARLSVQTISQKIRASSGINVDSSVFGIDPGVLSLIMASNALNPTIISLNSNDGSLQIKEGNNDATTITSKNVIISNLVFSNLSASSTRENIGIDLTVGYASSSDINLTFSQNISTAVSVRE